MMAAWLWMDSSKQMTIQSSRLGVLQNLAASAVNIYQSLINSAPRKLGRPLQKLCSIWSPFTVPQMGKWFALGRSFCWQSLHLPLSLPQPKLVAPSILLFILAVYLVLSISLDLRMKQKVDKTVEPLPVCLLLRPKGHVPWSKMQHHGIWSRLYPSWSPNAEALVGALCRKKTLKDLV